LAVSDSTTASTTGLLDISTRQWLDASLFDRMGLAHVVRLLPDVYPGGAQIGALSAYAAQVLGVPPRIPVHHGPGDAGAATIGVGSGEPGQVYAYVGTSGWVAFTGVERIAAETGVFTLAHPNPDKFIYVAPLLTAGGNFEWARQVFELSDAGEMITTALGQSPSSLFYLPYLNGERSPFSDPFARGAFIGLNARHTKMDLCRAVLEGVAYAYRHARDALISGPTTAITITGGGAQSRDWCQLFADITNTPITIADDASNVGLHGAVLAAQVNSGAYGHFAPPSYFPVAETIHPDQTYRTHFDHQYRLYCAAYPALKEIFGQMR
jgi:xylulokinase